jgi:cephalosporin hydroxylase
MRSNDLLLNKYDSDKIEYLKYYDPIFEPWLEKRVDILELGIFKGGSLLLWKDYFPKGNIVGVDINLPTNFPPIDRIRIFKGYQDDPAFLTSVANQTAPYGYDFIIDDASHIGELSKKSFWYLFDNHLKPGGIYAIEDWGTGYWNEWPDGSPN